jgi:uroporphyrinogen-III synthase
MTPKPLQTRCCLNTRPQHQATQLTELLKAQGAIVLEQPTLTINLVKNAKKFQSYLDNINSYHAIIFVSTNAVRGIAPYWKPTKSQVICVGPATAKLATTISNNITIASPYSSKGVLSLASLQNVSHKPILIISGSQFNPYLKETLQSRGAYVDIAVSYTVTEPSLKNPDALKKLTQSSIDTLISTSLMGLKQLIAWFQPQKKTWLLEKKVVVVSQSMLEIALEAGWKRDQILVSPSATDESILATLIENT